MSKMPKAAGSCSPQRDRVPRIDYLRGLIDRDRQRNPHLYLTAPDGLGPNYLYIENVALMLGCTTDYVRRISRAELPAAKVGKRVIYPRAAVEAFIERRIIASDSLCLVPDRKPRAGQLRVVSNDVAEAFDPVATFRKSGGVR